MKKRSLMILIFSLITAFSLSMPVFSAEGGENGFQVGSGTDEDSGSGGGFIELKLKTSEWAQAEVKEAYSLGLIPLEMSSTNFNTGVTREQFAAIAVKLYEKIMEKKADYSIVDFPFSDCDTEKSFTAYIAAAYKLGITNGTGAGIFSPHDTITREQLATMLHRVILKANAEGRAARDMSVSEIVFSDEASISEYATQSVYYMAQRGIIKGMSENTFVPQGVASKEQAVIISLRIAKALY